MEFHPTQEIVARDSHDYRLVNCGRQWGKTTLSAWEMTACAYSKPSRIAYFATTFDQSRNIAWQMLKDITAPIIAKPPNESRLELLVRNKEKTTSELSLRGFENVETARGQQFDLIVVDEVAFMKNFRYAWEAILEPTLAFRKGKALFLSTPKGFNHFNDMWKRGQGNDPYWKSWTFTSYENPFLPKDRIERARENSTVDYFNQEYLAMFMRFTGLIFKEFEIDKHVEYFDHEKNERAEYIAGMDFAVRGYTASLLSKIKSDGYIYIIDEYKEENETASNHSEVIKDKFNNYVDLDKTIYYGDPAGFIKNQQSKDRSMAWSLANEYQDAGFGVVPANNEVTAGINYVRQLFRENKIKIHPRCVKLIEELQQYQWKDQPEKQVGEVNAPEKPRKVNDHLVDCLRYMLYSKTQIPKSEENRPIMPIKFELKIDEPKKGLTQIDFPSIYDP